MTSSVPPGIAIHSSMVSLMLPVGSSEVDVATIRKQKAQILATLRSKQMDPAGFYSALPEAIHEVLQAATWLVMDTMTTAETSGLSQ